MTINLPTINVSKTTLNGYLAVALAVCVALLQVPGIPQQYTVAIGGAVAFLRILVGHLQTDAGTTLATTPGQPSPVEVPSHEVPDDPKAVAIAPVATFPTTKK